MIAQEQQQQQSSGDDTGDGAAVVILGTRRRRVQPAPAQRPRSAGEAPVVDLGARRLARERRASALRCVASGYLEDECSCDATVPADAVKALWARRLELAGEARDGFFRFTTRDGEWLGYGLGDGRVRGVYCPDHSARRLVNAPVPQGGLARV